MKSILTSTSEWGWRPRIYTSLVLCSISLIAYIYFERMWIWGYAGSIFLLLIPFMFSEKHIEFKEDKAEKLIFKEFNLSNERFIKLLTFMNSISIKGIGQNRVDHITSQTEEMMSGENKLFNLYFKTEHTESSISLNIQKYKDLDVKISANKETLAIIENYLEKANQKTD